MKVLRLLDHISVFVLVFLVARDWRFSIMEVAGSASGVGMAMTLGAAARRVVKVGNFVFFF